MSVEEITELALSLCLQFWVLFLACTCSKIVPIRQVIKSIITLPGISLSLRMKVVNRVHNSIVAFLKDTRADFLLPHYVPVLYISLKCTEVVFPMVIPFRKDQSFVIVLKKNVDENLTKNHFKLADTLDLKFHW